MGFIGDLFSSGNQYKPQQANITNPVQAGAIQYGDEQSRQALAQQQAFLQALQGQGGIGNQSNVFNQMQGLAQQLGLQAQGQGPNPALAQLAQATGQNVAQQGALMGSQRGAGANAGLIARQVGQQGGALQQNATGQAAILQAQQQLAAQQALQQQQGMLAGLAGQQVGQQAGALSGLAGQAQGYLGQNQNALSNFNNSTVGSQSSVNQANAALAAGGQKGQQDMFGGLANALGGGIMATVVNPGQEAQKFKTGAGAATGGAAGVIPFAQGGMVGDASCVPKKSLIHQYFMGGDVEGIVPGQAQHSGNTVKNDTVPAMLSPGEIVIPRSHATDPDMAAAFARAVAMRNKR